MLNQLCGSDEPAQSDIVVRRCDIIIIRCYIEIETIITDYYIYHSISKFAANTWRRSDVASALP